MSETMTEEIVETYDHDCRIVRERRDGGEDLYHYESALGQVKSFRNPGKARLYADVQTVTGGFREEKTGEFGVPPAVAASRDDVLVAYLVSNESMGVEWVAYFKDWEQERVRQVVDMVRKRAEEQRQENDQ